MSGNAQQLEATPAELFAALHTGTPGDLAFYLDACAGAASVLELGCGAGRILLPIAQAGSSVVGLDHDNALLALARRALGELSSSVAQRVQLIHADMRDFSDHRRFERILIPFNGLYALDHEADQLACLRRAACHLSAHGYLIWDAYAIDEFHHNAEPDAIDNDHEPVDSVQCHGERYTVYERSTWDKHTQRIRVRYRYQPANSALSVQEQVIDHRYLLTQQAEPLCRRAGLSVVALHGDFLARPLTAQAAHMVCIAKRADA